VTVPTSNGYADFLYATERKHTRDLKLAKLGCLGETTTTMRQGGICHYATGSQLAATKRFIAKHRVTLITLDIGANDVDGCVSASGQIDLTCVSNGVATIQANVPKILSTLRKAAGPKVKIAAITYYDPFLADYLTGASGQAIAGASVLLARQVNGDLTTDYQAQHVRVADVATAFDTYTPFTTTTTLPGHGTVPVAVAQICKLTWMCAAAPRGPNIHANTTGYQDIAGVFAAALR
jgi:lysophospholipase L1-like esterase